MQYAQKVTAFGELSKMLMPRRLTALCLLGLGAQGAHALGLGEIDLRSHLNQPLRATVSVRDVAPSEIDNLTVRVAPAESYERAGLRRDDYLRNLRFDIRQQGDTVVVEVEGDAPLREPVVDLILEARFAGRRLQRGYTLLIDPPDFHDRAAAPPPNAAAPAAQSPAPVPEPAPSTEGAAGAERATVSAPEEAPAGVDVATSPAAADGERAAQAPASATPTQRLPADDEPVFFQTPEEQGSESVTGTEQQAAPEAADSPDRSAGAPAETVERTLDPELLEAIRRASASAPPVREAGRIEDGRYAVRPGETLWRVAFNTRPDASVSMEQMMLAIVRANPEAFVGGDINALRADVAVTVPDREAAMRTTPEVARQQLDALRSGQMRISALVDGQREGRSSPSPRPGADAGATPPAPEPEPEPEPEAERPVLTGPAVGADEADRAAAAEGAEAAGAEGDAAAERIGTEASVSARPSEETPDAGSEDSAAAETRAEGDIVSEVDAAEATAADGGSDSAVAAGGGDVGELPSEDGDPLRHGAVDEATAGDGADQTPAADGRAAAASAPPATGREADSTTSTGAAPTPSGRDVGSGLANTLRWLLSAAAALFLVLAGLLAWRRRQAATSHSDAGSAADAEVSTSAAPLAAAGAAGGATVFAEGEDEGEADDLASAELAGDSDAQDRDESGPLQATAADDSDADAEESALADADLDLDFDAELADAESALGEATGVPPEAADGDDATAGDRYAELFADIDFRVSYGMHEDAVRRLQSAITDDPENAALHCKLAEVHHAAGNRSAFLKAAEQAMGMALSDEQHKRLDELARSLAPEAPAPADAPQPSPAGADGGAEPAPGTAPSLPAAGDEDKAVDFDVDLAADLDTDLDAATATGPAADDEAPGPASASTAEAAAAEPASAEPASAPSPEPAAEKDEHLLDFDLGGFDVGESAEPAAEEAAESAADDLEGLSLEDFDLELSGDEAPEPSTKDSAGTAADTDSDAFSLDDFEVEGTDGDDISKAGGDRDQPATAAATAPGGEEDDLLGAIDAGADLSELGAPDEDPLGTRMDLARAYVEMGDEEMARPLLEELLAQGSAEQQAEARRLMDELG